MKFDKGRFSNLTNLDYEPVITKDLIKIQDDQALNQSARRDSTSRPTSKCWDKIGSVVLNDMKNDSFDQICKNMNDNYYETKEKFERLASLQKRTMMTPSKKRKSRRSSLHESILSTSRKNSLDSQP